MIMQEPVFQGTAVLNSWHGWLESGHYHPKWGHGRVAIGEDGLPVALIFVMVDDFMIHGPTLQKTRDAFTVFMNHMLRLGFICQVRKTSPPARCQKFCGMLFDTSSQPRLLIPPDKVQRGLASIKLLRVLNERKDLTRLGAAVVGGFLQSLVDATPANRGQTYLRKLYDDVHHTTTLVGRALYYSKLQLSVDTLDDLTWWEAFLQHNPGAPSRSMAVGSLGITWGDGSGTGTGGTLQFLGASAESNQPLETWMGVWTPAAVHHDSNWKELRTLVLTLERIVGRQQDVCGHTIFYFTDNLVTYYVVNNGSSTSPELHRLIRQVKLLEVKLGCRLEPIHVPGILMIDQGTDALSRGLWIPRERPRRPLAWETRLALHSFPSSVALRDWLTSVLSLPLQGAPLLHDTSPWVWATIGHRYTVWTPSPEVAHLAIHTFLNFWVESPWDTSAVFVIPRVLQRDWHFMSRYVTEVGVYASTDLPPVLGYNSVIPVVLLHCAPFVRRLPASDDRMDTPPKFDRFQRWCLRQAEALRGVS